MLEIGGHSLGCSLLICKTNSRIISPFPHLSATFRPFTKWVSVASCLFEVNAHFITSQVVFELTLSVRSSLSPLTSHILFTVFVNKKPNKLQESAFFLQIPPKTLWTIYVMWCIWCFFYCLYSRFAFTTEFPFEKAAVSQWNKMRFENLNITFCIVSYIVMLKW